MVPTCQNQAQPITFTLRPTDGSAPFSRTLTLNADGSFSLPSILRAAYTLHVKGSKWLAKNVVVDATGGSVAGVSVALSPGDANNDNHVNIIDLGYLADHLWCGPRLLRANRTPRLEDGCF